jgi:hypothetical protein
LFVGGFVNYGSSLFGLAEEAMEARCVAQLLGNPDAMQTAIAL